MYKIKSDKDVFEYVLGLKSRKMSTRKIAEDYGSPITCADISRLLHGIFPKGTAKRAVLELPPIVRVELITSTPAPDGTQILEVRECIQCKQHRPFVPNVPSRRRCYSCSPKR